MLCLSINALLYCIINYHYYFGYFFRNIHFLSFIPNIISSFYISVIFPSLFPKITGIKVLGFRPQRWTFIVFGRKGICGKCIQILKSLLKLWVSCRTRLKNLAEIDGATSHRRESPGAVQLRHCMGTANTGPSSCVTIASAPRHIVSPGALLPGTSLPHCWILGLLEILSKSPDSYVEECLSYIPELCYLLGETWTTWPYYVPERYRGNMEPFLRGAEFCLLLILIHPQMWRVPFS